MASIAELLKSKEDSILGKGISEEKIALAEKELGLSFADDYKEYLITVGLAMCNGHEFTGIGKEERTNVVSVTKQMRGLFPDIPDDWYVIENENMDFALIWQDSEGNVYFNKKKEFSSFVEFIEAI